MISETNRKTPVSKLFNSSLVFYSYLALVFVMPIYQKLAPLFIVILGLISAVYYFTSKDKSHHSLPIIHLTGIALYLLFAVGLLYTENIDKGLFDLQIKLSFLVFPLILFFSGDVLLLNKRHEKVFAAFVIGVLTSTLICLAQAVYVSLTDHFTYDNFIYNRLSFLMHPSYYAMYLNVAIVICIVLMEKTWNKTSNWQKVAMAAIILYLSVYILFVNSKAGILITALTYIIFLFRIILAKRKIILGLGLLALLLSVTALVWTKTPYVKARFQGFLLSVSTYDAKAVNSSEGTAERILVWKHSLKVISENLPFGVGTGDVNAELTESYENSSFKEGARRHLNAHNQYFQTTIAIGIPGLIALLSVFIALIIQGSRRRNILMILFSIIVLANFMVESMLETQAGVVFIAFFISLLGVSVPIQSIEVKDKQ